jgi:hypothetical protein
MAAAYVLFVCHGHPCSRAHFNISKCPPLAIAAQVEIETKT